MNTCLGRHYSSSASNGCLDLVPGLVSLVVQLLSPYIYIEGSPSKLIPSSRAGWESNLHSTSLVGDLPVKAEMRIVWSTLSNGC